MIQTDFLESAILEELAECGTCTLEELSERLPPPISWNQVFAAVDRLTRKGTPSPSNICLRSATSSRSHRVYPQWHAT